MIVDSGTTLIYLPDSIVIIVNSVFDPPATFDASTGLYVVNYSAVAPKFGVCWRPVFLYQLAGYDAGNRTGGVGGRIFEECTRCVRRWGW